ncbi:hypothetical protein [Rhodococcus sp. CH91]|uniref:hypothetical protein n=1 Tax=Rhodococcus sp. CH91 TaxID=2910256 RepID=UPI001F4B3088|nr:hypothetical protein [Rhodococcus sp. CH91]
MTDPDDLLVRATMLLRTAPEPGWDTISDRVLAAVRVTPRPAWPLATTSHGPSRDGSIFVTDHVLRSILARTLRARYLGRPTAIDLDTEGDSLRAVNLEITGSYGTDLRELAEQVRRTATEVIDDLFTDAAAHTPHPVTVTVTITDIVSGHAAAPER